MWPRTSTISSVNLSLNSFLFIIITVFFDIFCKQSLKHHKSCLTHRKASKIFLYFLCGLVGTCLCSNDCLLSYFQELFTCIPQNWQYDLSLKLRLRLIINLSPNAFKSITRTNSMYTIHTKGLIKIVKHSEKKLSTVSVPIIILAHPLW